jgi:hypothetical protein
MKLIVVRVVHHPGFNLPRVPIKCGVTLRSQCGERAVSTDRAGHRPASEPHYNLILNIRVMGPQDPLTHLHAPHLGTSRRPVDENPTCGAPLGITPNQFHRLHRLGIALVPLLGRFIALFANHLRTQLTGPPGVEETLRSQCGERAVSTDRAGLWPASEPQYLILKHSTQGPKAPTYLASGTGALPNQLGLLLRSHPPPPITVRPVPTVILDTKLIHLVPFGHPSDSGPPLLNRLVHRLHHKRLFEKSHLPFHLSRPSDERAKRVSHL